MTTSASVATTRRGRASIRRNRSVGHPQLRPHAVGAARRPVLRGLTTQRPDCRAWSIASTHSGASDRRRHRRATERDPARRYESMADLIVAWRAAVGRVEGVLTPVGSRRVHSRRRIAVELPPPSPLTISSSVNPYKGLRPFAEADADDFFGRDEVAHADPRCARRPAFGGGRGPVRVGQELGRARRSRAVAAEKGARIATMVPGRPTRAMRCGRRCAASRPPNGRAPDEVTLIEAVAAEGTADLGAGGRPVRGVLDIGRPGRPRALPRRAHAGGRPATSGASSPSAPTCTTGHCRISSSVSSWRTEPLRCPRSPPRRWRKRSCGPRDATVSSSTRVSRHAIVAEASAQPAGLPLLQFALAELYERRTDFRIRRTRSARARRDRRCGRTRAEETYQALGPKLRCRARELFARLVAPGLGTPDTRRRARLGELSESARDVADLFVRGAAARCRPRLRQTREPVVEVAHEALLTNWPRLRDG